MEEMEKLLKKGKTEGKQNHLNTSMPLEHVSAASEISGECSLLLYMGENAQKNPGV